MAERIQQVEETSTNNVAPVQSTRRVTTATDNTNDRVVVVDRSGRTTAERVAYYITGVLLTILAFRFVLSLLGANRDNGFANLIYTLSYPFVAPFFGLFGYTMRYGVARFEIETLVAMVVYALIGYGIAKLIRILRRAD